MMKKFCIICAIIGFFAVIACSHSPYQEAKSIYENSVKKGDAAGFYRTPEFAKVEGLLKGIKQSDPEYSQAQALYDKILDERREARKENVKKLLDEAQIKFKMMDQAKKNDALKGETPKVNQTDPFAEQKKQGK